MLRQAPAELFGDFEAIGLGAFGVIGPQVHVHDRPAVLVGDLGAKAIDVVVIAADADHVRAEDQRAEDFPLLEIVRDHDIAADARLRRMGGGAVGQIAGAGAADRVETELDGLADRDADDPFLVGIGRIVAGIVLDPKFRASQFRGQSIGPLERRKAGMKSDLRLIDRQQILVSPEALGPARRSTRG